MIRMRGMLGMGIVGLGLAAGAGAATLTNPDFEAGSLTGWTVRTNRMSVMARTNSTFNRNYAAAFTGRYASANWITNAVSQSFSVMRGDALSVDGYLHWAGYTEQAAAATGYVEAVLHGDFGATQANARATWMSTNGGWAFFNLSNLTYGTYNNSFEEPGLTNWAVACDHLAGFQATNAAASGGASLRMVGAFTNWSWNQAYQLLPVRSGEVVRGRAKMRVDQLQTSGDWLVAGIKLEKDGGGQAMESVRNAPFNSTGQWVDLSFTMVCTQSGSYVYRCMVAGGNGGTSQADVYFDDVTLAPTGQAQTVTLEVAYRAHSGGSAVTSSAAIYLDALTLRGSTAGLADPTNIMTALRTEARTIGTNAAASIPAVNYPPLFSHGEPASGRFPGGIEAALVGWKFKYLTNNVALACTNTLTVYELSTNGAGYIEFDQYVYCGKNPHKLRGQPLEIATNGPYFALGVKDGRSSEFGAGPFPADHTYVVGTSLTNFPRRLATGAAGGWPSTLRVVFPENFSTFSNALWNKHFVLHAVVTNGAATGVKALTVGLRASKTGATNDVDALTQELHLGWASEPATAGLVDYPNVTYQDHNEVALRAPWIYNLVDDGTGWYMQQSPRGSATIEPLELFAVAQSNWVQRTYDETLFTWSHAASGVRSLFDDDQAYRLRGAVSYHVGLKVGHQYGTNDLGESNYPEVLNLRGNGYFRMADYDGVMAGSFRPMASDLFGLYKGKKNEDAPLMTKAYARVVPATSPTNDNSYGQVFASLRSKTNQFFIGIAQADLHFAPQEVAASGCYFDLQAETWAHQANIVTQHGPFSLFAQVSMHWRGGADINDGTEGHDVDCVMVKKADGEWVTHQILNPPTNVFHRTVAAFRSNDTVYLQQQDRGRDSYGFATETPYKRASSFEITMLNDGGLPLDLDVYEENASSEINDNIDIACNVRSNLAAKQNLKYAYRYRTVYAPGVTVLSPGESGGGEGWSNDSFRIEFIATDGHDEPLVAELYYGNGRDADWRLINTNVVLYVPTNTHRLAYDWNTAGVATGAYYIKVAARRAAGGKTGFDVSNTRLQVGRALGLPRNAGVVSTVTTNTLELGTNLSFEAGTVGWVAAADHLAIGATNTYAYHGTNAARFSGSWSGWSWNNLRQDITCQPGEVLHVTGKVRIQGLTRSGADWVGAGIKLEASDGSSATEQSFNETSATNTWLSVDFYRTAATSTERLILWVAGNDCPAANVYFDDFRVVSTNGVVITNSVSSGYWVAATAVNVTAHNALCLWAGGTNGTAGAAVWVADASGVTNTVVLTNHVDRLVSLEQRIEIPWSAFAGVNKAQIRALGFTSSNLSASRVRSAWLPIAARARVRAAPQADPEGLSLYYPGQVMTNVITITNFTATAQTNLTVQVVQEYGESRWWWDESPHVAPRWSAKTRRGDRLVGGFEQVWTNRTLPAGGVLVLTNTYVNPAGRLVTQYYGSNDAPWYAFRNYQSRAQVHVVVRRANGDNVYDSDGTGCYRVDDDSTQTNNTEESGSGSSSLLAFSSSSSFSSSSPSSSSSPPSSSARLSSSTGPEIVVAGGPQGLSRPVVTSAPARTVARLAGARGLPFADDFSGGLRKGWSVAEDPNIAWSVSDGALCAAAGTEGGYAYALVQGLAIRGDNVSMEFDVMFDDAAREGGLIYRGRVLQLNPTVCGWEDSDPRYIVACPLLTPGAWHRVAVDIRESPRGALSDLFIDGIPVFYDEPVEPGSAAAPFGFLSPYSGGTVRWDNVDVYHP